MAAAKKAQVAAAGFGVDSKASERKFGDKWSFGKQKLLSVIVTQIPEARTFLGLGANQKLSWEYGGWSEDMVKRANECLSRFADKLPPRQTVQTGRGNWR